MNRMFEPSPPMCDRTRNLERIEVRVSDLQQLFHPMDLLRTG